MLDSPEFPFNFIVNRMRPVLDGTGVVVGLLAASVLTASGGTFTLAFAAFLSWQKRSFCCFVCAEQRRVSLSESGAQVYQFASSRHLLFHILHGETKQVVVLWRTLTNNA